MKDANTPTKESFWKKMVTIIGVGFVLIAAVYFGKKYKTSQKIAEITAFYNQFSDQNYIEFAKELEKLIHENKPEVFDESVDLAAFFGFSNRELVGSHKKRKMIEALQSYLKIGDLISSSVQYKEDFIFTNFYKEEGIPHIVFRLYRPDIINFVDFTLGIKKDTIVIKDMYNFFSGILFSEMASDLYYKIINQGDLSFIDIKAYQQVKYEMELGNYEEAYNVLIAIPEAKRNAYHYQFLLTATSNFDNEKLLAVIAEMKASNTEDQRLHAYLNFKEHIVHGDLEKLNAAINDLKKHVGEDVIFDLYRGFMFNFKSDHKQAILFFDRIIKELPDFYDGYYYKLYGLLMQDKKEEAIRVTAKMNERFSISKEELIFGLQEFQEFTSSEAFKNIFKSAE